MDKKLQSKISGLPSRKELKQALSEFSAKNTFDAMRLVTMDYALFLLAIGLVIYLPDTLLKLVVSVLAGIQISRLFLIGHDACHQSFVANRKLNQWLGKLVFLPSMTPYKLWDIGHNLYHHGYTNLKGKDYVWEPLTTEEYKQLSPVRQVFYLYYRSGWGTWLYYLIEIWWNRLFFPNKRYVAVNQNEYIFDCLFVAAFGISWIALLVLAANITGQSAWLLLTTGFILPFLIWNALIGYITFVHHTHPDVMWYEDGNKWAAAQPYITVTIHTRLPLGLGKLLHNIFEHPAHHLDMRIPLYHLADAQKKLADLTPGAFIEQTLTWARYWDCVKRCKFYDYKNGRWEA